MAADGQERLWSWGIAPQICLTCCPSRFWVVLSRDLTHTHTHTHTDFCLILHLISSNLSESPALIFWRLPALWVAFLCSVCVSVICLLCLLSHHGMRLVEAPLAVIHTVAAVSLVMEKNCPVGWGNGQQRTRIMRLRGILPTGGHFSQLRGNSLPL